MLPSAVIICSAILGGASIRSWTPVLATAAVIEGATILNGPTVGAEVLGVVAAAIR